MPPPDFVLGCERSGSTWVANLLDAHARTEVYLEPFADFAKLFPSLPGRFALPGKPDASQIEEVRAAFAHLPALKHPYLYRPGRAPAWRRVDAAWAGARLRLARLCGVAPPLSVQRYRLLNLHASETPAPLLTRKEARDRVRIVKELRLHFRAELIRRAFPEARCLVLVRDPGAQIASVGRLFERGNLGELRRALPRLGEAVERSERLRRYRPLGPVLARDPEAPEALLAWWLISYDVLIADCRRLGIAHRVVFHETLARDPVSEALELLAFFGLEASPDVERYVRASSSGGHASPGPLSTFRDSAAHSAHTRASVPSELRRAARAWIEKYAESDPLHRYASGGG